MYATRFVSAILDPAQPVPEGLTGPDGKSAGKRFDVYRNNVAVSLTEALETGFPVVRKLVGAPFFAAMAGVFLRAHPPRNPVLTLYGEALPGFLDRFAPTASLPYLPDVARLELALRHAYHAADAAPFDTGALTVLTPERLMQARLRLAPAVRLVASRWPIHGIWRANTDTEAPPPGTHAQSVLVTRPGFDPVATALDPAAAAFVGALRADAPLEIALKAATDADPEFDLTPTLGLLLAQGAILALNERPPR